MYICIYIYSSNRVTTTWPLAAANISGLSDRASVPGKHEADEIISRKNSGGVIGFTAAQKPDK